MQGADGWVESVKLVGAALGVLIVGLAGLFTGRKKPPPETGAEGQVVAATFMERGLMERLTAVMASLDVTVRESTSITKTLVGQLQAETHRREVEAEVRQALKDRGIIDR